MRHYKRPTGRYDRPSCFIRDVFGDNSWITNTCRKFRDSVLGKIVFGRLLIKFYYQALQKGNG